MDISGMFPKRARNVTKRSNGYPGHFDIQNRGKNSGVRHRMVTSAASPPPTRL
ncbi:hypothetical protein RHECNPAF_6420055 [Rhizobium etli CNPAF512]|nr:hypothetical protein RHECNPAF_6420055 [Rhizobium etli CNPAF512]